MTNNFCEYVNKIQCLVEFTLFFDIFILKNFRISKVIAFEKIQNSYIQINKIHQLRINSKILKIKMINL